MVCVCVCVRVFVVFKRNFTQVQNVTAYLIKYSLVSLLFSLLIARLTAIMKGRMRAQ